MLNQFTRTHSRNHKIPLEFSAILTSNQTISQGAKAVSGGDQPG